MLVSVAVPILRRSRPDLDRPFRVPFSPVLPIVSALACFYLMLNLSVETWIRFLIWMLLGALIYFGYGYRRNRRRHPKPLPPQPLTPPLPCPASGPSPPGPAWAPPGPARPGPAPLIMRLASKSGLDSDANSMITGARAGCGRGEPGWVGQVKKRERWGVVGGAASGGRGVRSAKMLAPSQPA